MSAVCTMPSAEFYRVDRHQTGERAAAVVQSCETVGLVGLASLSCLVRCLAVGGAPACSSTCTISPAKSLDNLGRLWTLAGRGGHSRPLESGAPPVCRMQIRGLWEAQLAEHRRGAADGWLDGHRAGYDSHHDMDPWLQCTVLDESITAQLHDRQPILSAEAPRACVGKPQHSAIKEPRTAAAASAVNRARLVRRCSGTSPARLHCLFGDEDAQRRQ